MTLRLHVALFYGVRSYSATRAWYFNVCNRWKTFIVDKHFFMIDNIMHVIVALKLSLQKNQPVYWCQKTASFQNKHRNFIVKWLYSKKTAKVWRINLIRGVSLRSLLLTIWSNLASQKHQETNSKLFKLSTNRQTPRQRETYETPTSYYFCLLISRDVYVTVIK